MGYQAMGVCRFYAVGRFQVTADDRKQGHDRNAQAHAFLGHMQQQIKAHAIDPGHRGNRLTPVLSFKEKYRIDQIVDAQSVFANQSSAEVISAQTPWTTEWEGCCHG